ncbi:hypothetical protein [Aeromonas sp. MrichA-1]|uniref:hypothetical protein n=1 Tax=Aeromonas sp. MrichA-1 TaxID=2823362 RepID=UPI001B345441|nr:hypothetical protein [Aeromonas sp. MrichA-1]MBP4081753.1 hypothetical protein [Aeromonas sp. MrichA-1]
MQTLQKIKKQHKNQQEFLGASYRLGQHFCSKYIKNPWPELFYANDHEAEGMIAQWLADHSYHDTLPPVVEQAQK